MEETGTPKLASPLYILREQAAADLPEALGRIAALGFDGVEMLGLFGRSPKEIRTVLDDLGLVALGDHVPWGELRERPRDVLEDRRALGCAYVTVAGLGALDTLPVEDLGRVAALAKQAGMRLLFHNHAEELQRKVAGRAQLEEILDAVGAGVLALEPDIGWMQIGGGDPAYFLRKYADRCPVVHLKDFFLAEGAAFTGVPQDAQGRIRKGTGAEGFFEFRPCGYGVGNTPALLPLIRACRPQWIVADHDCAYERDPYGDLALSLSYLQTLLAL